ncbi:malonyl-[acyl-carrier protein] O-methyltransferase BioC [Rhodobacterales bacterium 52_120_T64]|nr:malonyl-[acyl-carrier protein] O-methyltransferase BioC [Rhodobacterales bacterium 52_120_T64]
MTLSQQAVSAAQSRIQRNFHRGFSKYSESAYVQAQIASRLVDIFAKTANTHRFDTALEIGCGTGFLTKQLFERFEVGHYTLNDLVPSSKTHITNLSNAEANSWGFVSGAIETVSLVDKFDLIASASAIQWVSDTPALLRNLANRLKPNGWLMLSSFTPQHFGELKALGTSAQEMSYFCAKEWEKLLPADLKPISISQGLLTAKFCSPREMLVHLRNTGVNANSKNHWSRKNLIDFEQEYAKRFSDADGNVRLTYAPVYIIAQKKDGSGF